MVRELCTRLGQSEKKNCKRLAFSNKTFLILVSTFDYSPTYLNVNIRTSGENREMYIKRYHVSSFGDISVGRKHNAMPHYPHILYPAY